MDIFENFNFEGVKGVLLDFDNTVYKYDPCHTFAVRALFEKYGNLFSDNFENFEEKYKKSQNVVKSRISTHGASHSRLLYIQNMIEAQFGKSRPKLAIELEKCYWDSFISQMKVNPQIIPFLKKCNSLNVKVCVLTDLTSQIQFRKLIETGLDEMVDFVVTSEEAGADKPNESIFRLALLKMGLGVDEVVMIGDSQRKDIDGANKIGIKGYLV